MVARCPCSPEQVSPSRTSELGKGRLARGSLQQGVGDSVVRLGQPPFPPRRLDPEVSQMAQLRQRVRGSKRGWGQSHSLGIVCSNSGPDFKTHPLEVSEPVRGSRRPHEASATTTNVP